MSAVLKTIRIATQNNRLEIEESFIRTDVM